ncbi:hypothetical protein VKT23_002501 [Stygiomarasmius scandens]|uniref:Uncharacterized protein n=1 Tax=Marasmiellus scandens TaxID=2682957 RepID=A0ABR1K272_9AGAR
MPDGVGPPEVLLYPQLLTITSMFCGKANVLGYDNTQEERLNDQNVSGHDRGHNENSQSEADPKDNATVADTVDHNTKTVSPADLQNRGDKLMQGSDGVGNSTVYSAGASTTDDEASEQEKRQNSDMLPVYKYNPLLPKDRGLVDGGVGLNVDLDAFLFGLDDDSTDENTSSSQAAWESPVASLFDLNSTWSQSNGEGSQSDAPNMPPTADTVAESTEVEDTAARNEGLRRKVVSRKAALAGHKQKRKETSREPPSPADSLSWVEVNPNAPKKTRKKRRTGDVNESDGGNVDNFDP